ncbi:fibro-slime domain-containing protein [uncultured Bifidobacterium sp.]|uniref:DUF7601 domain-containing protein n=2 Tax=Bifidobacterium TaxID=1678 RepID=UPI0025922224|nr:fibro-slime domain-containing protein [uncultured Bifidobacterium sp.]
MRKLRSVVAALAAVACLYVPSAAAEPASTSDPVPPAVVAPTQTEDQTETPTGDEEVAGDTETPDQATDETPAESVDETPKQDADVVEEQPDGTVTLDQTLTYANDEYTVDVTVRGDAVVSDAEAPAADAVISDASGDLAMTVDVLDESQPEWQAVEDYAESKDEAGDVLDVTALDFGFTYQGQTLDVSGCELNATVAPTDALVAAGAAPKAAAEAETGVEVTALNSATEELGTVMVAQNEDETKTLDVTLDSSAPVLGLAAKSALNPHFTVQYYANLKKTIREDDGYLKIIDTDNGGTNQGGNLPDNGDPNQSMTGLYLEDDGSVRTRMELTELYTANEYNYFEAPSLPYVNIFRENGNYTANEVWVLKDGKDASSTNEDDWTVYKDIVGATELHFTNNPDKANDPNTIYIKDDTVIRLVANQTVSGYDNDAIFYDFDITDDGKTTWDGTNGSHGINSASNYSGTGAKLAFGNVNTGTGLGNESWNGNTLNKFNEPNRNNNLQGTTFGLVTGLDGNGHIQYADGVDAPKLFDDGNATGKTTYNGWSLGFNRQGDTYTLSSVADDKSATVLDDLEQFNNPVTGTTVYDHIWTNNFWPMDDHPGKDGLTGDYMDRGKYVGSDGNQLYPPSDDGLDHNNLFGMQYEIQFKLTEDYIGPLEYYFFGDDDMWVFLDGKLVCDIGGVHSSVGEYVNLWDYIAKGSEGTHTLKFYYTERGLSGSTCYMQFTLPSVSSVPPEYQNGQLKVQKQVVGTADPDTEFSFDINIWSDDGSAQGSDYSIVRYSADGTQRIESTLLTDGKGTFKLKANQYVIIDYLQHGTHYTIKETNVPGGVTVSNTIDNGTPNQSAEVTGTTPVGKNSIVLFTNTFRPMLPNTGGSGVWALSIGGLTLMTFAVVYSVRRRNQAINLSRS